MTGEPSAHCPLIAGPVSPLPAIATTWPGRVGWGVGLKGGVCWVQALRVARRATGGMTLV
ncbi:hypothetical protein GCM10009736_60950 [Actinomadura bangladeshensis]